MLFSRVEVATKPGVGTMWIRSSRWPFNKVQAIDYQPDGTSHRHTVPEDRWNEVMAAQTREQAMAAIRR